MHRNSFLEPGWGAQGSMRRAWELRTPQLEHVEGLGAAGHVFVGVHTGHHLSQGQAGSHSQGPNLVAQA